MPFTDEQIKLACELNKDGLEWFRICDLLNIPKEEKERLRSACRRSDSYKAGTVLVFSDTHLPFMHPNYMEFVYDTAVKYRADTIVHCGDLVDHHALSFHTSEPEAHGSEYEAELAQMEVDKIVNMFDDLWLTIGNHDRIPERKAKELGLGNRYVKRFEDMYGLPSGWKITEDLELDDVLYTHGLGYGGKDGAYNGAIKNRMSLVMGHAHSFAGCKYMANKKDIVFGMNVGCGIDVESYAAAYGKHIVNKPILGCGIVKSSEEAYFVPMGSRYMRSNR